MYSVHPLSAKRFESLDMTGFPQGAPWYSYKEGRFPVPETKNLTGETMDILDEMRTNQDLDGDYSVFLALAHLGRIFPYYFDDEHANGLPQFRDAKHILVSGDELNYAENDEKGRMRMQKKWWADVNLETFDWNGTKGPAVKSYDLFEDGSIVLINIPGHTPGQAAVKITGRDGKFFLYFADGGYTKDSWAKQIPSGVADNREEQSASLAWIRSMSLDPLCTESQPNHDPDVEEHVITLEA